MNNQSKIAVLGDEVIGQVSSYAALPAVMCPNCGEKLHRVFNTPSKWKYIGLNENILVAIGTEDPPIWVTVE